MGIGMRLLALAVLSGVLAMLGYPRVSSAGYYEVDACTETVGYVNNSWHLFDSNSQYLEANSACDEAPTHELSAKLSNLAVGDILGAGDPPVGVEAGWRFSAPVGTTISQVKGSDDLFKDTNNDWQVYLENANKEILGGQTCLVEPRNSFYCETSGLFQEPGLTTQSVSVGVVCATDSSEYCPGGATIHEVRAELDYATVTITDELVPTSVTGARIPTGPQRGMISISGSAVDAAAGLLSLSVVNSAGEAVGGPVSSPTHCNYSFTTPCPTNVEDVAIPIDTTKLPNGDDQLRVEATNAAHDEGFSAPFTIDVENVTSKQGGGGSGGGGSSSGGSNTGGSGGSGTMSGGSSGTGAGQSTGSGSPSTSTGSGSSKITPVPVKIHLGRVRRIHSELVISGHLTPAVMGDLTLTVEVAGHRVRVFVPIVKGRFHAVLRLGHRFHEHHLMLRMLYKGSSQYARAVRVQALNALS
jgi:hypothetical protein